MSVLLELHYDKDDILETYLNEVYLGQAGTRSIHGVGLASQFFFGGESLKDIDVHQIALLIGMVKGPPSYYNPRRIRSGPKRGVTWCWMRWPRPGG